MKKVIDPQSWPKCAHFVQYCSRRSVDGIKIETADKTFAVATIVAALLAQPDLKMLCMAPLNVAVVKICEKLVQALEVEGYRDQLNRISNNLLESAVTAESFWQQLNEKMNEEERR
ncbi:hypothetical protein GPALN_006673 [Globodera pallida]|nr:hypothetical protein GPALN_006673 [Globodera pallida]